MFSNLMQKRGLTGPRLGKELLLRLSEFGTTSFASMANGRLSGAMISRGALTLDIVVIDNLRALANGNSIACGK
jgi:hypothetical protein